MKFQRAEKFIVVVHAKNHKYEIQFDEIIILNKEAHFGKRMQKEEVDRKMSRNSNRKNGCKINKI